MTKNIIYILMLLTFNLNAQSVWMTRNLANYPLDFLTPKDSIPNLYEVKSGIVITKEDTLDIEKSIGIYYESSLFNSEQIKTYLLYRKNNNLYVTLTFCYNRLFQISMFSNKSYYLNNFKFEIQRVFKNKGNPSYTITADSTINYGSRIVSYGERYSTYILSGSNKNVFYKYEEDLINESGYLILTHKGIYKKIPSWCGICNHGNSWKKLKIYIEKLTNQDK